MKNWEWPWDETSLCDACNLRWHFCNVDPYSLKISVVHKVYLLLAHAKPCHYIDVIIFTCTNVHVHVNQQFSPKILGIVNKHGLGRAHHHTNLSYMYQSYIALKAQWLLCWRGPGVTLHVSNLGNLVAIPNTRNFSTKLQHSCCVNNQCSTVSNQTVEALGSYSRFTSFVCKFP